MRIPSPNDLKKEGSYNPIKLPEEVASKKSTPGAADNLTAMCNSGKPSAEQQAKYCNKQDSK